MFFLEESGFCRNIMIHSTMEIEMILGDIGEKRYVIVYTVISIIIYPMTGSLKYQVSDSERTCFSESLPECKRTIHSHLWSIFIYIISHPELCCRDETYFFPVILECFCYESTSSSLTFCTCDTDNIHIFCRIAWKCKSHYAPYKVVGYSQRTSESYSWSENCEYFVHRCIFCCQYSKNSLSIYTFSVFDIEKIFVE